MKIQSRYTLNDKEGYYALIYMLQAFFEDTGSSDLTDILSGAECWEPDIPADPVFWEYWLEAIERVKRDGPPPLKYLM